MIDKKQRPLILANRGHLVIFVVGTMTLLLPVLKHDRKVAWSLAPFFRLTLSDIKSKSISCSAVFNSCDSCDPV